MSSQKNSTKLMPTDDVIAEKIAITEAIGKESSDDKLEQLYMRNESLNEKYKFFDIVFEEDGKKGIKDIAGNVRVPAIYCDFSEVYSYGEFRSFPVAAFNADDKCALVKTDGTGTPLCPFEYDNIRLIQWTNFFIARKGKKLAVLSCNGSVLVDPIIDVYHECLNGITTFESDGKFGLITYDGMYVPPIYDEMDCDENDDLYVTLGDKKGFIDCEDGHFIDETDEEDIDCSVPLGFTTL